MQSTIERQDGATVKVTVEASAEDVAPALKRAVANIGRNIRIPGFRPGKAPRKVLEGRVGRDYLQDQVVQQAIPELLSKAVDEHDIVSISQPRIAVTSYELDGDLTFEATIEVRPEVPEPNYSLLHVEVPPKEATEEEIVEQLARMQDRFATLEPVTRPIATGDFVRIDVVTTIEDEQPEQLQATDQLYEVGSMGMLPGLDDELLARATGETLTYEVTLPEAPGPFSGKVAVIGATIKETSEKRVPDLDDAFASDASEFETLEELRADIATKIAQIKEQQAESLIRTELLEQAVNDTDFAIPDSIVVREMAYRLERFEQQLKASGATLETYLAENNFTEEQVEADLRSQAERNVRAQMLLEQIAKNHDIQVTEDDLTNELAFRATAARLNEAQTKALFGDQDRVVAIAGDIVRRKALTYLVEQAGFSTGDGSSSEGEAPSGGEEE
jgi:trigger factor